MINNLHDKTIIFFSLYYPFHFSDSYLDEEVEKLSSLFGKVVIISNDTDSEERRSVPSNAVVYRYRPITNFRSKIWALTLLFTPFFYREINKIIFTNRIKMNFHVLKELFAFYSRAQLTKRFLEKVVSEEKINTQQLLIYTYWMIESSMAAVLLKRNRPEIKVISKAHSQDVYFERTSVKYQPFRKFIFNYLDHLYFISDNAMKYFSIKHCLSDCEQKKISISRIGIMANRGFIAKNNSDTIRIISVAYIQPLKRINLIIDALALIKDIRIEWIHVGHSHNAEEGFNRIKEYAEKKVHPNSNISFYFSGKTNKQELFGFYKDKNFDFFLNVSETEGIPVSMMEAMSYSVPVIGTNVGGVAEIVQDGINGFLLKPYPDANEVAQAIKQFEALSCDEKNELRKNAFKTWDTKYNGKKNNVQFALDVEAVINE